QPAGAFASSRSVRTSRPFRSKTWTRTAPGFEVWNDTFADGLRGFGEIDAAKAPPVDFTVIVRLALNVPPVRRDPRIVTITVFRPLGRPLKRLLKSALRKQTAISSIPSEFLSPPTVIFPGSGAISDTDPVPGDTIRMLATSTSTMLNEA